MKKATPILFASFCASSALFGDGYDAQKLNRLGNTRDYKSKASFSETLGAMRRQLGNTLSEDEFERPWEPVKEDPIVEEKVKPQTMGDVSPSASPEKLETPDLSAEEEAQGVDLYREPITRQEKFQPTEPMPQRVEQVEAKLKTESEAEEKAKSNSFYDRLKFSEQQPEEPKPSAEPALEGAGQGFKRFREKVGGGFQNVFKKLKLSKEPVSQEEQMEAMRQQVRERFDAREKAAIGEEKHLQLKAEREAKREAEATLRVDVAREEARPPQAEESSKADQAAKAKLEAEKQAQAEAKRRAEHEARLKAREEEIARQKAEKKAQAEAKRKADQAARQKAQAQKKKESQVKGEEGAAKSQAEVERLAREAARQQRAEREAAEQAKREAARRDLIEKKEAQTVEVEVSKPMLPANPEIIRRYKKHQESKAKVETSSKSRREKREEKESIQSPIRKLLQ